MRKYLASVLLPLLCLFGISLLQAPVVSATEHADVITKMYFTDRDGTVLSGDSINQWQQFRINADFNLHNNQIQAGDTTVIQLPEEVTFASPVNFDITDQVGHVIAKATVDSTSKQIVVTYTDYVETHSDITGTFFFYIRVDHQVVQTKQQIPLEFTVSGKVLSAGTITFNGIGDAIKTDLDKTGWPDGNNPQLGYFSIAVNRTGRALQNVQVVDTLKTAGVAYKQGSFRITKGNWVSRNGEWVLDNEVDITSQQTIVFSQTGFSVDLPDLAENEGYLITYQVDISYTPVDGEFIANDVTLKATKTEDVTQQSGYTFLQGNGEAEGYVYAIKLKKVSEDGLPLAGAVFEIIRDRSGVVVGQVETDENGEAELPNLLRDTYTIREIKAPAGYRLAADTKILESDFDKGTRIASKTIIDEKIAPITADLFVTKVLTGRALKAGEFSFSLTNQDGKVVQTVKNAADGSVRFDSLTFTKVGTYTYTITEDKGTAEGVTYDTSVVTATVTVTDDNQGHLVATVTYANDDQTFENSYKPKDSTPPTSSDDTSSSTTSSSDKKDDQQTVLPSTGSTTGGLVALVGLVLLAGLGYVLMKKEK